jgi:hypothetical protein
MERTVVGMTSEITDLAERALRSFGGELTREQAALLLTMWRYSHDLTETERAEVLDRFPSVDQRAPVRA